MNNRELVMAAVRFEAPHPVPYDIDFTGQMLDKMIAYTGNPQFLATLNNAVEMQYVTKPEEEIRPEYFRDEFGVVWNRSGVDKDIGVVDELLLEEPEDLVSYQFPPVDEAYIRTRVEAILRSGEGCLTMGGIGFSLFERAWTLRGMENLLCDMVAEPDFVHALMEKITRRNLKVLDIAMQYNLDSFYFGDDWGQQNGLIMGPTFWRKFIKPYLAQMYGRVRSAGKLVCQHSCGDIRLILDDLYDIGLNIYQTFQPEIYGLEYAKKLENRIAIWGGISTQQELPVKTPQEIEIITQRLLDAFPRGGLIAAPTHLIPGDVPPDNILAMVRVLDNQRPRA